MRWLACIVACVGCDGVFHVDVVAVHDGGPSTFCATLQVDPSDQLVVCPDFDTPTTGLDRFTQQATAPSSITTTTNSFSPPFAMVIASPHGDAAQASFGPVTLIGGTTYDFDFNVQVECGQLIARLDLEVETTSTSRRAT